MDSAKFNCRECKNPKCNRMATGGYYCTACQHIYDALEAENKQMAKHLEEIIYWDTCPDDMKKDIAKLIGLEDELLKEES